MSYLKKITALFVLPLIMSGILISAAYAQNDNLEPIDIKLPTTGKTLLFLD